MRIYEKKPFEWGNEPALLEHPKFDIVAEISIENGEPCEAEATHIRKHFFELNHIQDFGISRECVGQWRFDYYQTKEYGGKQFLFTEIFQPTYYLTGYHKFTQRLIKY